MEEVVNKILAGLRIKRFFLSKRPLSRTCVLTQEIIKGPIFRYYPNQNHSKQPIGYSLDAILQYIQVTGKDIDPMTREKWSKRDYERIDLLMSRYKLHEIYLSPLRARQRRTNELQAKCLLIFRAALRPSNINDCKNTSYFYNVLIEYEETFEELRHLDVAIAIETLHKTRSYFVSLDQPFQRYHDYIDATMGGTIGTFMDSLI